MTSDVRVARILNGAMFAVLCAASLGLIGYSFATHLVAVQHIYLGLSPEDRRHVLGLVNAAALLALAIALLRRLLIGWIGGRRTQSMVEPAK
jgi:hypothetical protein